MFLQCPRFVTLATLTGISSVLGTTHCRCIVAIVILVTATQVIRIWTEKQNNNLVNESNICSNNIYFISLDFKGERCRSVVRAFAHGAMGRRVDPSWSGPIELFLVPASAPRLCNKGRGMCYPVCGMVHIKEPLLLIEKSSLCGGSRFPLPEWCFTICLMPYNHK